MKYYHCKKSKTWILYLVFDVHINFGKEETLAQFNIPSIADVVERCTAVLFCNNNQDTLNYIFL